MLSVRCSIKQSFPFLPKRVGSESKESECHGGTGLNNHFFQMYFIQTFNRYLEPKSPVSVEFTKAFKEEEDNS